MQVFINNNPRFCYRSKEKLLSSKTFGRMQIWTREDRNGEPYSRWFKKKSQSDGSETESDIDNGEYDE